ncbi:MAG: hypothetical protein COW30_08105 [Rhodospirillales bacterium CG15_BIG_FIL_POST_REV_8_21_14_020_66_15]|nr:MAG: hypothetical protein COW30_08105 [Rhodospirillales bacterium CG15_BIG_FIL_POST_REV_8_21_14_020_66_15]
MTTDTNPIQQELDILQRARLMQNDVLFLPLVRGVLSLAGRLITGLRRSAMRRELLALDDRMLRDIGLRRDDIPSLVAGAFAGEDRVPGTARTAAELYYLVPASPKGGGHGGDRLAA